MPDEMPEGLTEDEQATFQKSLRWGLRDGPDIAAAADILGMLVRSDLTEIAALRAELAEAKAEIERLKDVLRRIGERARKTYETPMHDGANLEAGLLTIGVAVCSALGCRPIGKQGHVCGYPYDGYEEKS